MMLQDIRTVMWKERKGLLRVQGSLAKTLLSLAVPLLMVAVFMPLQLGERWVEAAWSLAASVIIPLILVGIVIPQSFAGERERHTLETLLASRLPDRAILFGKVLLAIAYGWGLTLAALLVALIPVNLFHWAGQVLVYRPAVAVANLLVSLLMSALIANLGVLVSLRSATAQGAQQALISMLLVPLMVLQVIPMVMLSVVPNGMDMLEAWLSVDLVSVVLVVVAVLVVMNAGLLVATMARFKRSRLQLG